MSINATQLGLAFVPGPAHLPQLFSSEELQEIAEYPPEAVTTALLQLPDVALLHRLGGSGKLGGTANRRCLRLM